MQVQANSVAVPVPGPTDTNRPVTGGASSFGTVLASSISASSGPISKAAAQPTQDRSAQITTTADSDPSLGAKLESRLAFKSSRKAPSAAKIISASPSKTENRPATNQTPVADATRPLPLSSPTIAPLPIGMGALLVSTAPAFAQILTNQADANAVLPSQTAATPAIPQTEPLAKPGEPPVSVTPAPSAGYRLNNSVTVPKPSTTANADSGPADGVSTVSPSGLFREEPTGPVAVVATPGFPAPADGKLWTSLTVPMTQSSGSIESAPNVQIATGATVKPTFSTMSTFPVQLVSASPTESTHPTAIPSSPPVSPAVIPPATLAAARTQTIPAAPLVTATFTPTPLSQPRGAPSLLVADKPVVTPTFHISAASTQTIAPRPVTPPGTTLSASATPVQDNPAVTTDKTGATAQGQTLSPTPTVSNSQVAASGDKVTASALQNSQASMAPLTPGVEAIANTASPADALPLPPSAFTPSPSHLDAATLWSPAPTHAPQISAGAIADPQPVTLHASDLSVANPNNSDLQTDDPKVLPNVASNVAPKVVASTAGDIQADSPAPANAGAGLAAANGDDVSVEPVVPAETGGASGIFSDSADGGVSDDANESDRLATVIAKPSDLSVSNLSASNLTVPSNAPKAASGSMAAAAASDASSSAKSGDAPQLASAAPAASTTTEKKPAIAGQTTPNVTYATGTFSGSNTQMVPAVLVPGKDGPPVLAPLAPALTAPPTQAGSESAPTLPQTHQMLDSAPLAEPAVILPNQSDSSSSDAGLTAQVNAQMHVGIRSDAFGSVEIHTVVQQSEIGITVHSDRDIARWFSSEIPGLESGLNSSHLNLTGVSFDSGSSGVQTGSGSQQDQPRQHFTGTPGFSSNGQSSSSAEEDPAPASASLDVYPSDLLVRSGINRVSIHA
jgi:hypothetical protein